MSISEKANDLLNKFGSAQYDYVVWSTQDNLVARDKARQEISDYIAELEAFIKRLIEAGDAMSNSQSMWVAEEDKWDALVKDWKEREE